MQVGQLLGETPGPTGTVGSAGPSAPRSPSASLRPAVPLRHLGPGCTDGPAEPAVPNEVGQPLRSGGHHLDRWLLDVRHQVAGVLTAFVRDRCAEHVHDVPGAQLVTELLGEFVAGGKFVRSTFTYLGWLSG